MFQNFCTNISEVHPIGEAHCGKELMSFFSNGVVEWGGSIYKAIAAISNDGVISLSP